MADTANMADVSLCWLIFYYIGCFNEAGWISRWIKSNEEEYCSPVCLGYFNTVLVSTDNLPSAFRRLKELDDEWHRGTYNQHRELFESCVAYRSQNVFDLSDRIPHYYIEDDSDHVITLILKMLADIIRRVQWCDIREQSTMVPDVVDDEVHPLQNFASVRQLPAVSRSRLANIKIWNGYLCISSDVDPPMTGFNERAIVRFTPGFFNPGGFIVETNTCLSITFTPTGSGKPVYLSTLLGRTFPREDDDEGVHYLTRKFTVTLGENTVAVVCGATTVTFAIAFNLRDAYCDIDAGFWTDNLITIRTCTTVVGLLLRLRVLCLSSRAVCNESNIITKLVTTMPLWVFVRVCKIVGMPELTD